MRHCCNKTNLPYHQGKGEVTMKRFNFAILFVLLVAVLGGCATKPPVYGAAGDTTLSSKGLVNTMAEASSVADGTYHVYIPQKEFVRTDFRITMSGGSGTITLTIHGTMEGGCTWADEETCTYDDIGLDFYTQASFVDADSPVKLIDNGEKIKAFTWIRLTFVIAGAAADGSYQVMRSALYPGA
jgi:hypothetical protein